MKAAAFLRTAAIWSASNSIALSIPWILIWVTVAAIAGVPPSNDAWYRAAGLMLLGGLLLGLVTILLRVGMRASGISIPMTYTMQQALSDLKSSSSSIGIPHILFCLLAAAATSLCIAGLVLFMVFFFSR